MTAEVKAIRVNMMFGKRTISGLMDELLARKPYARAKLIRKLAFDGWRLQQGELRTAMPLAQISPSIAPDMDDSAFDAGVLSLLGKSIRTNGARKP